MLEILTVADAMQPAPAALAPDAPLDDVIRRFTTDGCDTLPVVDADGSYRGAVTVREAEEAARAGTLDATASQLARALPFLHPGQTLHHALTPLLAHEGSGLPVLADDGNRVAGWLQHRDILNAYSNRLHRTAARLSPLPGTASNAPTPLRASRSATIRTADRRLPAR